MPMADELGNSLLRKEQVFLIESFLIFNWKEDYPPLNPLPPPYPLLPPPLNPQWFDKLDKDFGELLAYF